MHGTIRIKDIISNAVTSYCTATISCVIITDMICDVTISIYINIIFILRI